MKNIYPSSKVMPYVYMGIHKTTRHIYIGYREANTLPSHLDIFEYRTSSKIVNPKFDEYEWYILAEFFDSNSAYDLEQKLIFENWNNPLLLNQNCQYGKRRFKPLLKHTEETCAKKSKSMLGKNTRARSYEVCQEISKSLSGRKLSETHRKNLSIRKQGTSNPNSKIYKFIDPLGNEYHVEGNLKSFCKQHSLSINGIINVIKGRTVVYKGWYARYK
ncbi:MAG TPA: hypothetical protein VFM18_18215 [Methanosarcina sp.]|nr:hypothetical protein [Methanosarcina sp.]